MNCGFIDLDFAIDLERITRPWTIEVPKRSGVVRANEKLKLEIRFMAGKRKQRLCLGLHRLRRRLFHSRTLVARFS